jgi:hypothetical protein
MFKVRWTKSALNDLAAAWTAASSKVRIAITQAASGADLHLSHDPLAESESRSGNSRVMFWPPLTVYYRPENDGHTVTVLHVRLHRLGKK